MRFEFFQHQVERLRNIYSPGALNQERIDLWWKRFRSEPDHVFENALNHVIAEATSQQLPAMSRVAEALGFFRTDPHGASMQILAPAHACEPCRDFGYVFDGDLVVPCQLCPSGRVIAPEELAHAQGCYDRGGAFLSRGAKKSSFFHPLPYDHNERIGGGA